VIAAVGKLQQPKAFLRAVADYQLLPLPLAKLVAAALPGVESLAGGLLLLGAFTAFRRRPGQVGLYADAAAWIVAGLLAVFIVALSVNLLRGFPMDCGCFDVLGSHIPFLKSSQVTWGTVGRDVVMLALAYPILRKRG